MTHCMLKLNTITFCKYKHKKSKWITNGILKSINTKDKLFKALVKTDCTNSTLYNNLKTNFKTYKNILRKTVREAKKVYYNRVFLQYKDNI